MRGLVFAALLLAVGLDLTLARNERLTDAPASAAPSVSLSPTMTPQPSSSPTKLFSTSPSARPSATPSYYPTDEPSAMPSTSPPTPAPSVSQMPSTPPPTVVPTQGPTDAPSSSPSVSPTSTPTTSLAPSASPSAAPTSVVALALPNMQISFFLRDSNRRRRLQQTPLSFAELELLLSAFLSNALSRHGNFRNSFEDLDLDTDTEYNSNTGRVDVDVQGTAVFKGSTVPTEDELKEVLLTYFSFFGTDDLETFLQDNYVDRDVSGLELSIDGTMLQGTTPKGGAPPGGSDDPNTGLIVGVVIACVASLAMVGFAFMYTRGRKDRSRRASSQPVDSVSALELDTPVSSKKGSSGRMGASPRRMFSGGAAAKASSPGLQPAPPPSQSDVMSSEQDQRSLSGMVSLEESLFTTADAESLVRPHQGSANFEYDASRLDQVISSAKGFAKEYDTDDDAV